MTPIPAVLLGAALTVTVFGAIFGLPLLLISLRRSSRLETDDRAARLQVLARPFDVILAAASTLIPH